VVPGEGAWFEQSRFLTNNRSLTKTGSGQTPGRTDTNGVDCSAKVVAVRSLAAAAAAADAVNNGGGSPAKGPKQRSPKKKRKTTRGARSDASGVAAACAAADADVDADAVAETAATGREVLLIHYMGADFCPSRKRAFFEFSLCLSRACLGEFIVSIRKWRKKTVFTVVPSWPGRLPVRKTHGSLFECSP
jgi:hypothetical protein